MGMVTPKTIPLKRLSNYGCRPLIRSSTKSDNDRGDYFEMSLIGQEILQIAKNYPEVIAAFREYGIYTDDHIEFARKLIATPEVLPLIMGMSTISDLVVETILKRTKK